MRSASPDTPSDDVIANYKQEPAFWIVVNAMREAAEAFGIFLDRLFEACVVADDIAKGRTESREQLLNTQILNTQTLQAGMLNGSFLLNFQGFMA